MLKKTSGPRFEADQPRLKIGVLAYALVHINRQVQVWGEEFKQSLGGLINRPMGLQKRMLFRVEPGERAP